MAFQPMHTRGGRMPPGGASSFSFADGGTSIHDTAQLSANAYANGQNQNCGNVMTGRSTTRLHAPPGGHSSIVFDDGAPSPPPHNAFRKPGYKVPPVGTTDQIQKGQIPVGGHSSVFDPDAKVPSPVAQRGSIGGHQNYRFGQSPLQNIESNNVREPVGGKSNLMLGSHNRFSISGVKDKTYGQYNLAEAGPIDS